MQWSNLKHPEQRLEFKQAVLLGLGQDRGLFFPEKMPVFEDIDALLDMSFIPRCVEILAPLVEPSLSRDELHSMLTAAFNFSLPLAKVTEDRYSLELFHGPTLAFKDFGARFMAQCLAKFSDEQALTILTATSGDTGAAVAHAFYGLQNVNVVILYPKQKISVLQEKMFCTLGDNIHTFAVDGDFDACQELVKQTFEDTEFKREVGLNSANSINVSRLVAQICYYFEAMAQLPKDKRSQAVFSVPCGNFGNLTAGMMAKAMGLPIKRFVAATNINDTVPRYLKSGQWKVEKTQASLSNAMDVSDPNNWPRIEAILERGWVASDALSAVSIDEQATHLGLKQMFSFDYLSEPHAAVAWKALKHLLFADEVGVFLATAHPAKFKDAVENLLGEVIAMPKALADVAHKENLSKNLTPSVNALKKQVKSALEC